MHVYCNDCTATYVIVTIVTVMPRKSTILEIYAELLHSGFVLNLASICTIFSL